MNEIRKKRTEMGITQEEAAAICGVSRRTYQYYENDEISKQFDELLNSLITSEDDFLNVKKIKDKCSKVFATYPEIKCAYLYGSYARNQATKKSDVDILVVCPPMGLKFYGLASELENATMGICSRKEILENFIEEYINNKDKETIVIDLDEYYD